MTKLIIILLLFTTSLGIAQVVPKVIAPYLQELDSSVKMDKLVIGFVDGIDEATGEEWIISQGFTKVWYLPERNLMSVRLAESAKSYAYLRTLLEELEENNQVLYANPILETEDRTGYAVQNRIYVKPSRSITQTQLALLHQTLNYLCNGNHNNEHNAYEFLANEMDYGLNIETYRILKHARLNALEISILLHAKTDVDFAEPDYVVHPKVATNDQHYSRQWAHVNDSSTLFAANYGAVTDADIDVDSAWTITKGSNTIRIAVIDSGVDTLHADLINNLVGGYDATGNGNNGYPNLTKRSNAHGTACSGIIAAEADNGIGIAGIAPECLLVPIRAFYYIDTNLNGLALNDIPFSTSQWFTDAIGWASQTANADILSNSWGLTSTFLALLPGNPAVVDSIVNLATEAGRGGKGTILVFSSGNEDTRPIWPAKRANTIAVNATSMCDERKFDGSCDGESWTGCWGQDLDVSAPGVKIVTCDISGAAGYQTGNYTFTFNGTSAACPQAAGVLALMLSVRPDLTLTQARWILSHSAEKVGGYDYNQLKTAGSWSRELGYGRINAYNAVKEAQSFIEITDFTGIQDSKTKEKLQLSVFPNPVTNNAFSIGVNLPESLKVSLKVYSVNGKLMYSAEDAYQAGLQQFNINLPELNTGMYFVKIEAGTYTGVTKLCVARD